MLFRQILHEDLGCASYLIGDSKAGVAAVVDPQWDIDGYLRLTRLHGVSIDHILETHNHADHVSGHGRLATATGAKIHVNRLAEVEYEHEPFDDGWRLELGSVVVEAIHTPGHRPEHTSFLLLDSDRGGEPWAVLTGDLLFVGDVARPDLAIDKEEGAAGIFHSLHDRLLRLPDEVEVWPGHVGGSLCGGAGLDHKTSSTIGFERSNNSILGISDEREFVERAIGSLGDQPPNFKRIVAINRGPLVTDAGTPTALSPRAVEAAVADGAIVIDARTNEQFDEAHIPGALSVSAGALGFATKVGQVVPPDAKLIVVAASDGYELEASELLAAAGLRVHGYLAGGMTAWREEARPVERIELLESNDLAARLDSKDPPLVLDVRSPSEWNEAHIPGSIHIHYPDLLDRLDEVPGERPIATICSGGKRSGLAASILQRKGFDQVLHVAHGGVGTWERDGRPVEAGEKVEA